MHARAPNEITDQITGQIEARFPKIWDDTDTNAIHTTLRTTERDMADLPQSTKVLIRDTTPALPAGIEKSIAGLEGVSVAELTPIVIAAMGSGLGVNYAAIEFAKDLVDYEHGTVAIEADDAKGIVAQDAKPGAKDWTPKADNTNYTAQELVHGLMALRAAAKKCVESQPASDDPQSNMLNVLKKIAGGEIPTGQDTGYRVTMLPMGTVQEMIADTRTTGHHLALNDINLPGVRPVSVVASLFGKFSPAPVAIVCRRLPTTRDIPLIGFTALDGSKPLPTATAGTAAAVLEAFGLYLDAVMIGATGLKTIDGTAILDPKSVAILSEAVVLQYKKKPYEYALTGLQTLIDQMGAWSSKEGSLDAVFARSATCATAGLCPRQTRSSLARNCFNLLVYRNCTLIVGRVWLVFGSIGTDYAK